MRYVSTHSRLKAAGSCKRKFNIDRCGFNTQPPEGGWAAPINDIMNIGSFNTQPPEGGWDVYQTGMLGYQEVSTHSRLKAAGRTFAAKTEHLTRFNTQPPEGGWARLTPKPNKI